MTGLQIDTGQLDQWTAMMNFAPAALHIEIQKRIAAVLGQGIGIMRSLAPFLTGKLRGSIHPMRLTATSVSFGTSLVYAAQRNFGGTIRAKNKPYLVFRGRNGGLVRVKEVTQKGTHYLERTVAKLRPIVRQEMQDGVRIALKVGR